MPSICFSSLLLVLAWPVASEWKPLWTLPKLEIPDTLSAKQSSTKGATQLDSYLAPLRFDTKSCIRLPSDTQAAEPCRRAGGVGSGILLSVNDTNPPTEVVSPLKLQHHRGEFVDEKVIRRYKSLGIKAPQVMLAQVWTGAGISFSSLQEGDWPGDNGNFSKWQQFIENVAVTAPEDMHFDIWNEPDGGYFWGRPREQYYDAWHVAVRALRQKRPQAKIIGPSISNADWNFILDFLKRAKANGTLPDILSWHWYSYNGMEIPGLAATARSIIAELGVQDTVRGISINEIVHGSLNFNPGVHVVYFANLERAGVDSAMHACWPEPTTGEVCSAGGGDNCGEWGKPPHPIQWRAQGGTTLDGLLTCDGSFLPRSVWWAYKAYGALNGTLLATDATDQMDGLASVTDDGLSMTLVIARLAGTAKSTASMQVMIANIPETLTAGNGTVNVAVAHIPDTGVLPLSQPSMDTKTVAVDTQGTLDLDIQMTNGEVVLVYLGSRAFRDIEHFAEPPLGSAASHGEFVM